jgi:hypothetical protein
MSLKIPGIHNWQESLIQGLPERFRAVFENTAKNNLLKQVDTLILVFNDRLYRLSNGTWRSLGASDLHTDPERLADAAAELLQPSSGTHGILLLLPAHEFLATSVSMPGVGRDSMKAALQLQAHTLLPGYESNLALAVNIHEHKTDTPDVAVWITEQRLNDLFDAFARKNMLLAAVMPRMLAPASAAGDVVIEDSDLHTVSRLHYRHGVLISWLQTSRLDLQQDVFLQQWQQLSQAEEPGEAANLEFVGADDYLAVAEKLVANREYSFIPKGAEALKSQLQKGKRIGVLAAAAVVVAMIGLLPFLIQSIQARSLLSTLEREREQAETARRDRDVVRAFEQEWGAFTEFPRQNLVSTLLTLQEVITPGVLASLEIDEGFIKLEGDSPDPQSLLERLEQTPIFTEVDFSRATSNTRYFIDLRLSTVDFPAYKQRYFPDAR